MVQNAVVMDIVRPVPTVEKAVAMDIVKPVATVELAAAMDIGFCAGGCNCVLYWFLEEDVYEEAAIAATAATNTAAQQR